MRSLEFIIIYKKILTLQMQYGYCTYVPHRIYLHNGSVALNRM